MKTLAFIAILATTHAVVVGLAIKLNGIAIDAKANRVYNWMIFIWIVAMITYFLT